jgi:hypothetical protein
VDAALLTPLVRQVLEDDKAKVFDWHYQPVAGGIVQASGGSYGVYRFNGQAHSQGRMRPWSLILKATAAAVLAAGPIASADASDVFYWKREVLIYQSGILANLPEGLVAVRCFGVVEYPDQEFWMWLEDVDDRAWSREDYGLAAYHLGQFNGAYLTGRPIPQAPWLSSGHLRTWLDWGEAGIMDIERLSRHPINQKWLERNAVARMIHLWSERERLLAALDCLPRTFCHYDAVRRNLMIRCNSAGEAETVAIDWAMAGIGFVGAEIAAMIGGGVYEIPACELEGFEAVAFSGYIAGLRRAGWLGDLQLARFGFVATIALFMGLGMAGHLLLLFAETDEIEFQERFFGRPSDELTAERAVFQRYFLDLGEEALALLDELTVAGQLGPAPG